MSSTQTSVNIFTHDLHDTPQLSQHFTPHLTHTHTDTFLPAKLLA